MFSKLILIGSLISACCLRCFFGPFGIGDNDPRFLWPNATIPYVIDQALIESGQNNIDIIEEAIQHWNEKTIITLIPRSNEEDHVVFELTSHSCGSAIGRDGGRQIISCDLLNGFDVPAIIHEIGHAVGLYHEQSRSDRDAFVRVVSRNIIEDSHINFQKEPEFGQDLGPYDFNSIMHYTEFFFAIDPEFPTIIAPKDIIIGRANELSAGDISSTAMLYNRTELSNWTINADGSWERTSRISRIIPNEGAFVDAATAQGTDGLHILGVDLSGNLWHVVKKDGNMFSPSFNVEEGAGDRGGKVTNVSCTMIGNTLHVCAVNADGQLWHTTRTTKEVTGPDGSSQTEVEWSTYESIEDKTSEIGFIPFAQCFNVDNDLHIMATNDDGQLWHTAHTKNRWLRFSNIGLQAGQKGFFTSFSCARMNENLHITAVSSDGNIWYSSKSLNSPSQWSDFVDFKGIGDFPSRTDLDPGKVIFSTLGHVGTETSNFQLSGFVINSEGRIFEKNFRRNRWQGFTELQSAERPVLKDNLGFFWRTSMVQDGEKSHMLAVTIP